MSEEINKLVKNRHHAVDLMAVEKNRVVSSIIAELDGIMPALTQEHVGYVRQAIHLLRVVNGDVPKMLGKEPKQLDLFKHGICIAGTTTGRFKSGTISDEEGIEE